MFRITKFSRLTPVVFLTLFVLLLSAACRDKTGTGPDGPNPGTYTLELRAPDTVHFGEAWDTIVVRVYYGSTIPTGVSVHAYHESLDGEFYDNTVIAQSDTVAFPCGSNPCLRYHCPEFTTETDVVTAYAILSGDTVATAQVGFVLYP
ncbi:hypothetical protein IT157_03700 [bacterium]|nr:hypothetical protein [bacterium]